MSNSAGVTSWKKKKGKTKSGDVEIRVWRRIAKRTKY